MKKLLILIISVVMLNAVTLTEAEKTKLKTPLFNIFSTTDWGLFLHEFEINFKIGFCGKGLNRAIGIKAHMIEPIGYFETTKRPLYFPFADLTLNGNILRSGHTRASITSEGGRDEFVWSHFIYVPIMGMIFKKKIPIFCFQNGDLALPLISELMPFYNKDVMYKNMIGQMAFFFTPQGLLSTVLDCTATVADNAINGFDDSKESNNGGADAIANMTTNYRQTQEGLAEKGTEFLRFVRNSLYFSVGCLGFAPVGGYIPAQDPGTDIELLTYAAINLLHGASSVLPTPILYKQTNFSMSGSKLNNITVMDTMCAPEKYPMGIESQYVVQRAYPTVGKSHELGIPGIISTTAANVPGSKDSFVNVVWERRDYYAFAYLCPGSK